MLFLYGFIFLLQYDLNKHLYTHIGQKLFNCFICNKAFGEESRLKKHEEQYHTDVEKYECNQCDKAFITESYLQDHMEKHKKKRPYMCVVCGKSFVFKQVGDYFNSSVSGTLTLLETLSV